MKHSIPFLCFRLLTGFSAALVPTMVCVLMGYLLMRGVPVMGKELLFGSTPPLDAVFGRAPVWDGLWPACVGTFWLVVLTMLLALFPGTGCGIFLAELASPLQKKILGAAVDMLAGMPSIVMGLFGFMLILLLRHTILPDANTGLLLAAGCLALLVLPVLAASTREAMNAVPRSLRLAAAASGFSRSQALFHLFLPAAAKGILGGVVLAVGRAAEDTAVILFTGVVANAGLPAGLFGKFEALSFDIYYVSSQYQNQQELLHGFGAAALLLGISCLLLAIARLLEGSFRRKWQGKA